MSRRSRSATAAAWLCLLVLVVACAGLDSHSVWLLPVEPLLLAPEQVCDARIVHDSTLPDVVSLSVTGARAPPLA